MGSRKSTMARMKTLETAPAIKDMEIGEFIYDLTNDQIVVRLVSGLVTFTKD